MSGAQGTKALSALLAHLTRLADWYSAYKPACKTITISRRDYDLLRKYPLATTITEKQGIAYWRGFQLRVLSAPGKK